MGNRQLHYITKPEIESIRARVKNWGGLCLLCGESFSNVLVVSREHVIPRCLKKKGEASFFAVTHYRCNNFRQHFSIVETAKKLADLKVKWGDDKFYQWVNKKVPCRRAAPELNVNL